MVSGLVHGVGVIVIFIMHSQGSVDPSLWHERAPYVFAVSWVLLCLALLLQERGWHTGVRLDRRRQLL